MKRAIIEPGPVGTCAVCKGPSGFLKTGPSGEPECCRGFCWSRDWGTTRAELRRVTVVVGFFRTRTSGALVVQVMKSHEPIEVPFRVVPLDECRAGEQPKG